MEVFVSPIFSSGRFLLGFGFGIPAGLLEEIGWSGFAFPKMLRKMSCLRAGILLGLLWGFWHLPVIDFLGTATPHGGYLMPYFLSFIAAMTAMRVLIGWVYVNTRSLPLAQLLHASSTGSLVLLSPPRVNSAQEALWYAIFALALWVTVGVIFIIFGEHLAQKNP